MKSFNEVQKGDFIYSVHIDMMRQSVDIRRQVVKKVFVSNHILFEDGEQVAFTNQYANSDIMTWCGVMYFTNPAMAKRQVQIEYRRMYETTELMISKFRAELELWGENMRNWMENNK